jgi:hypothetical protein
MGIVSVLVGGAGGSTYAITPSLVVARIAESGYRRSNGRRSTN